jgi:hypothetical protein
MSKILKVSNGNYKLQVQSGGQIVFDAGNDGTVSILSTKQSGTKVTGALVVAGGVGIGGNITMDKILTLSLSTSEPINPEVGMFAIADRTNWNPASKLTTSPYPVFYDGLTWQALY